MSARARADAVIVGAGHNGLVAAVLLARAGMDVFVVERDRVVGGAARTERPFSVAPELAMSTGAPLLGAMPPELLAELGVELPLLRRDPHAVLATTGDRCVLFGADREATRRQLVEQFSQDDWRADEALRDELAALRDDLAPSWLAEPLGLEQTAERYVRPALRGAFVELCRGSVGGYLDRFGFRSELVKAMYAAGPRSSAGIDEPGSGAALLAHHMSRLPGAEGAGTAVRGGIGTVTQNLAYAAVRAGARFVKGDGVAAILCGAGAVAGVALDSEREIETDTVVCNADPFRMRALVGRDLVGDDYDARLDGCRRDGTAFALHLALSALPELACMPGADAPFRGAIQLLPDEGSALDELRRARADARAGRLPELPAVEWITHTAADPSLSDAEGRHAASLYVHPVPYRLADRDWDAEAGRFTRRLLAICDRFAPGTSDRVIETVALPPPELERRFGLSRGHIHHVDNAFAFADRVPYATPIDGLYACSAATHPAGGVIGAAGHNAAKRVLADRRH